MKLNDLIKEFSQLNDDELMSKIEEIRRRRVQAPALAKQAAKKKIQSKDEKLIALLRDLPMEQVKLLLKGG